MARKRIEVQVRVNGQLTTVEKEIETDPYEKERERRLIEAEKAKRAGFTPVRQRTKKSAGTGHQLMNYRRQEAEEHGGALKIFGSKPRAHKTSAMKNTIIK